MAGAELEVGAVAQAQQVLLLVLAIPVLEAEAGAEAEAEEGAPATLRSIAAEAERGKVEGAEVRAARVANVDVARVWAHVAGAAPVVGIGFGVFAAVVGFVTRVSRLPNSCSPKRRAAWSASLNTYEVV